MSWPRDASRSSSCASVASPSVKTSAYFAWTSARSVRADAAPKQSRDLTTSQKRSRIGASCLNFLSRFFVILLKAVKFQTLKSTRSRASLSSSAWAAQG